jgi:hypothetical protein
VTKVTITPTPTAALVQGVKPWKLEVTWVCQDAYGSPVEVELHIMGERVRLLRQFEDRVDALMWAYKWAADRGFDLGVVSYEPGQKYVYLHPKPVTKVTLS